MPPAKRRAQRQPPVPTRGTPPPAVEVVDPVWLIKALGLTLAAALVCVYISLCLLFYQGEWQLILHPSRTVDRTPASVGLDYTEVHFDATETGQPRLTGWWIPAQATPPSNAQPSLQPIPKFPAFTILYLHDGSGSLSGTVPLLARLHRAGLNVFAIDYRGFGASDASVHPSYTRMTEDAAAALNYLISTRHIPARNLIPYGAGLGGSLAATLARAHPGLPAVILDNPDPDPSSTAVAEHPSHFIPVRLLFGDQFDIAAPLATLATPKLLIAGGPAAASGYLGQLRSLYQHAASPKFTVTLPAEDNEAVYRAALSRFLDQYLPAR